MIDCHRAKVLVRGTSTKIGEPIRRLRDISGDAQLHAPRIRDNHGADRTNPAMTLPFRLGVVAAVTGFVILTGARPARAVDYTITVPEGWNGHTGHYLSKYEDVDEAADERA